MFAYYGGFLSTWNGSDYPEFNIEFADDLGSIIESSLTIGSYNANWTNHSDEIRIPVGTRIINFVMMGTRNSGSDNDSYFDDMQLRLRSECDEYLIGDLNQDQISDTVRCIGTIWFLYNYKYNIFEISRLCTDSVHILQFISRPCGKIR